MELFKKLLKVKSEIGKISKEATNPFFKSKYFDVNQLLEHVEPLLAKYDLLLLQPIVNGSVISQIIDPDTGEKVESAMELPTLNDPQKIGSAVTYYRRYTLQSLLGLQAEDDDANKASAKQPLKQNTNTIPGEVLKNLTAEMGKVQSTEQLNELYKKYNDHAKTFPSVKAMFTAKKVAINGN
jgi:hypothetical protein